MSTSPTHKGESTAPPEKSTVLLLLGDIGGTTWRLFIPTIGMTIAGVYLDNKLDTKPWLTVIGIVLGTILAVILVRNQLQKVNK
ncbi:AtpZ/AtpI family protein [Candidatus Saccharibacteria bacterium]|nr:AtpZ/AtpI family protein [Candidatus Saccharibacteria bacterium]